MAGVTTPPTQVEPLLAHIGSEFGALSKQLKTIAHYVAQHRESMGAEKIENLARNCNVQPSAVVRFAKHFGFQGYRDFKAVFRSED